MLPECSSPRALAPILWPLSLVRYGNDSHFLIGGTVDHAERKSLDQPSSRVLGSGRTVLWMSNGAEHGVCNGLFESDAEFGSNG
jgi:hypothetical protein